jgi:phosphoribosylformylglycinamidine cyclo-ligase
MLDGKTIRPGDQVIGIASSGLHTNGYSLARKIFFQQLKLKPSSCIPELKGTIGEELLKVHVSYGTLVQALLKKFNTVRHPSKRSGSRADPVVKAFAHITGGGFVDNIPRVLPGNCDVVIEKGTWEILPIFELIRRQGRVSEPELYQVFNMGIGMTAIVSAEFVTPVLTFIERQGHHAWRIGEVLKGDRQARVV